MRLKAAIEEAKAVNMPADTLKRAIQKGTGELPGETYEEITYEGYGPGGVAVMVKVLTDNKNRTAPEIRHTFAKFGGNLGDVGLGGLDVRAQGRSSRSRRPAWTRTSCWRWRWTPARPTSGGWTPSSRSRRRRMKWRRSGGRSRGRACRSSPREVTYVPQSTVRLEGKDAQQVLRLVEALEELDDVQHVYANYDIPDEVLEAQGAA